MRYLLALLALGALVAFHELAHLIAARALGVQVPEFSFGVGPRLLSFRAAGIQWFVRAIPLGGSARLHGMHAHPDERPGGFGALSWPRRAFIVLSGSAANFLLGIAVITALFVTGTHVPAPNTIGSVEPGSEAARAQLRPGDIVRTVGGQPIVDWSTFSQRIAASSGRPLELTVERAGWPVTVTVTPRPDGHGNGQLGLTQQYVFRQEPLGHALVLGGAYAWHVVLRAVAFGGRLIRGDPTATLPGTLSFVRQGSNAAVGDLDAILRLLVSLSIALAAYQLLPLPSLDGGRLLFIAVEAITRRQISSRAQTAAHGIGFLVVVALLAWVSFTEVRALWRDRVAARASSGR